MKKFLLICGFLFVSLCSAFAVDFNSVKTACKNFITDKNANCLVFNISAEKENINGNVFIKAQNVRGIIFTEDNGDCLILFSFVLDNFDDYEDDFSEILRGLSEIELDKISSISYANSILTLDLSNFDL